jgi:ornithine carbamoyltransferase
MIVIRASNEKIVLDIANNSTVPVINALTNSSHPCQIMADIMTYEEKRGSIRGKKVVWFGDGNNVCQSFLDASAKFDFNFVFCGPRALKPKKVNRNLKQSCGSYLIEADPKKAIEGADLVVTDTWVSMHDTANEYTKKKTLLEPYQVNMDLLQKAPSECFLLHCMPIYRGNEVTESVAKKFKPIIIDQAENRLHVQKSIMRWCLSEDF